MTRNSCSQREWNIKAVQVQTVSWCNRDCFVCPSKKFPRTYNQMSMQTYERILDELVSLEFCGRFSPYLMGEPLLDNRICDMVFLARKKLPQSIMLIQTNGDLLTVEKGLQLFRSGLHKLIINCYDTDAIKISKAFQIAEQIAKGVPGLKFSKGTILQFSRIRRGTRIPLEIQFEARDWNSAKIIENRAGNVPGLSVPATPLKKWCHRPFDQLYILANGDVCLCCCDWKEEVIFGNLWDRPVIDILEGDIPREYRKRLREKNRHIKLCEHCNYSGNYSFGVRYLQHLPVGVRRIPGYIKEAYLAIGRGLGGRW